MRGAERNRDREGRADIDLARDVHRAPMEPDQFLDEGESDAGAFEGTPPRALDPVERSNSRGSSSGECPRRCPTPAVEPIVRPASGGLHAYLAVECVLERVRQQVEDDLLPQVGVETDGFAQRLRLHTNRSPAPSIRDRKDPREFRGEGAESTARTRP